MNRNFRWMCLLVIWAFLWGGCQQQRDYSSNIVDKQEVFDRYDWWDNQDWSWYKSNIPFFDSPADSLDEVYYYRWEMMTKHLVYASPETGYMFTEFIDRPRWSGAYGGISCPLGHQFYEVRWLKNRRIINDFARYWFETPGVEPRSYSNWYGDAMWGIYKVRQNHSFIRGIYPYMKKQYHGFVKEHYNNEHGMFMWNGLRDGMEVNINSRQTENRGSGAYGFRPTLNSYMYADLKALSKASELLGKTEAADQYEKKARQLKQRVQYELWDPDRNFFFHQFAFDEKDGVEAYSLTYETGKYAGNPNGREQIGFVPWQFNLPDPGYEKAWQYLMDKNHFRAEYGPTTVSKSDPQFHVSDRCCVWSGNSWPYATTQTLVAMANLLHDYDQEYVNKEDYVHLLKTYAKTQYKDGRPYIAEAADPFTGSWEGHDHHYHSEHYFHSGYVNNVITGLVGLRPRADDTLEVDPLIPDTWDYFALEDVSYHGHNVSIVWDRHGQRYGKGQGLMIFVDGRQVASSPEITELKTAVSPVSNETGREELVNFAVNNGREYFPYISASYSHPERMPFYANDGNYWYHKSPANRWTTEGSSSNEHWIAVNFGVERLVKNVKLYFLDDEQGVSPPEDYHIQVWRDGGWRTIEDAQRQYIEPVGRKANTVTLPTVQNTQKIRVKLETRPDEAVGLTELEVWGYGTPPLDRPIEQIPNLAYNEDNKYYPNVSASYENGDLVHAVNDMEGLIPFNHHPRWSARNSGNDMDWVEIEFGPRKHVQQVDILFWGHGHRLDAPRTYHLEYWDGSSWQKARNIERHPEQPTSMALNTLTLEEPVHTNKIRLKFHHQLDAYTAVSEIMVWSDTDRSQR